jgi:hypothetical protein
MIHLPCMVVDSLGNGFPKENVHVSVVCQNVEIPVLFDMMDAVRCCWRVCAGTTHCTGFLFHLVVVMRKKVFEQNVKLKFSVVWFRGYADDDVRSNWSSGLVCAILAQICCRTFTIWLTNLGKP